MKWPADFCHSKGGITAEIATSVTTAMENAVIIEGSTGTITLTNPWVPGRNAGPSDSTIDIKVNGSSPRLSRFARITICLLLKRNLQAATLPKARCRPMRQHSAMPTA